MIAKASSPPPGSVVQNTAKTSACPPELVGHNLCPLITHSSPSRLATVAMCRPWVPSMFSTSDPLRASVIAAHPTYHRSVARKRGVNSSIRYLFCRGGMTGVMAQVEQLAAVARPESARDISSRQSAAVMESMPPPPYSLGQLAHW